MKFIHQDKDARAKLLKGINTVADIVKATLGPCGSNVVIKKPYTTPTIMNDGVSIAREITLQDETENAGASLLTEAAAATNTNVGDGTTTTCILTQGFIQEGFKLIEDGFNPIELREELKNQTDTIIKFLQQQSSQCKSLSKLTSVATISIGGDKKYGKLVAEALKHVGVDGAVDLQDSRLPETTLKISDGYKLDRGYMSPYFINDLEKFRVYYEDVLILCVHTPIKDVNDIKGILEFSHRTQKPVVLIVNEINESIFNLVQVNVMKKICNICLIKSPGFGFNVRDYMNDLAVLTGCTVIADETIKLSDVSESDFGVAKKLIANREHTTIVGDSAHCGDMNGYIKSLKVQLDAAENKYIIDSLKERISKLASGVAVIEVGAKTDTEQQELKLRFEDAINATRAAMMGGTVAGGGSALANVASRYDYDLDRIDHKSKLQRAVFKMCAKVLMLPENQICINSAIDKHEKEARYLEPDYGYNGVSRQYENLREAGILDPTMVVQAAVENAISVASTVLTTHATIISSDQA